MKEGGDQNQSLFSRMVACKGNENMNGKDGKIDLEKLKKTYKINLTFSVNGNSVYNLSGETPSNNGLTDCIVKNNDNERLL